MIPQAIGMLKGLPKGERNWKVLEDLLDEVQKKFPDLAEWPLFRCNILLAQDRGDDAEKLLRGLVEKNPKIPQYWQALTLLLVQRKKLDDAEKILASFEKNGGDTLELRLTKANYYVQRYGKEALPRLQALEEKTDAFDDQQKNVLWGNLLNNMREIGARDEIAKLTKMMAERDPNNINYLLISFEQAYEAGDMKRLEQISDNIERIEGNGPYWFTSQAIIRIQKVATGGDPALLDEALKFLDKAKEKRANWSKIPYLTGRIYDAKKDPVQALKFYQDAIDLGDYQPVAIGRVVDILCQQQKFREANVFLQRLERNNARFPVELLKKWTVLCLQKDIRDYDAALEKAHKVAASQTDNYKDLMWFGQVLNEIEQRTRAPNRKKEFEGLMPEEEKAFRRAVELNPDAPETWVVLVNFLVSTDKLSEAEKTLDDARKKFTGKEGQLALAQCLELLKKYEQAKEQYELVLAADPQDANTTRIVAEFLIRMSGVNQAQRASYVKQAETLLTRIIDGKEVKSNKADVLWARNKLALIVSTRPGYENIEKARALLQKNMAAAPDSIADKRLMAQINLRDPRQSVRDEAKRILKGMMENQTATDEDRLNLAQLYLAGGDWNSASELLRDLAIGSSDDPKYLAHLYPRTARSCGS